jgi:hypothetical protein
MRRLWVDCRLLWTTAESRDRGLRGKGNPIGICNFLPSEERGGSLAGGAQDGNHGRRSGFCRRAGGCLVGTERHKKPATGRGNPKNPYFGIAGSGLREGGVLIACCWDYSPEKVVEGPRESRAIARFWEFLAMCISNVQFMKKTFVICSGPPE